MALQAPYADLHKQPTGPGDARPTAMQVIKDQGLVGNLTGKTVLITGATSGIGLETARALYATGAQIFITARDAEKGAKVAKELSVDPSRPVQAIALTLDSLASVRTGAAAFLAQSSTLNILINNAGIMACPLSRTVDGYEAQLGTNHLGHALLFALLLPALKAGGALASPTFASRVVVLSSSGHRMVPGLRLNDLNFEAPDTYDKWAAYGQSKLAGIYFANEIERRYGEQGVHALSVHPGSIETPLQRFVAEDPRLLAARSDEKYLAQMKSTEQGAATTVWAAVAKEWEGKGGRYCEDLQEAGPAQEGVKGYGTGYSAVAYDEGDAGKLWAETMKMIGLA